MRELRETREVVAHPEEGVAKARRLGFPVADRVPVERDAKEGGELAKKELAPTREGGLDHAEVVHVVGAGDA